MYKAKCLKPVYCPKKARARQLQMCQLLKEQRIPNERKIVDMDHHYDLGTIQRRYKPTSDIKDVSVVSCHYAEKKLMVLIFLDHIEYVSENKSGSDEDEETVKYYYYRESLVVELIKQTKEISQFRIANGDIVEFEREDFILIPFQPLQHVVQNLYFNAKSIEYYESVLYGNKELQMISRIASFFGDSSKLKKVPVQVVHTAVSKHWAESIENVQKTQVFSQIYYKFYANIESITGTYMDIEVKGGNTRRLHFDLSFSFLEPEELGDLEKLKE